MSPHGRPKGEFPLGGLRSDAAQSLRTGLRLPKRAGMQADPWTARGAKEVI
jgi:hypothetical protein